MTNLFKYLRLAVVIFAFAWFITGIWGGVCYAFKLLAGYSFSACALILAFNICAAAVIVYLQERRK